MIALALDLALIFGIVCLMVLGLGLLEQLVRLALWVAERSRGNRRWL